jgi:oxygen-independent coproporphyrinogen-3 oxidase
MIWRDESPLIEIEIHFFRFEGIALDSLYYHPKIAVGDEATERIIPSGPIALYVHIPFCDRRCYFCEFAVVAGRNQDDALVAAYLDALKAEIAGFARRLSDRDVRVETIQIGGGTPTFLTADAIAALIDFILDQCGCRDVPEIVVEGFPTSITDAKLAVLARLPAVKFNIGVQTLEDPVLAALGRTHKGAEALAAITASVARLPAVGADIIFGLPGRGIDDLLSDIDRLAAAGIDHVAFYPLWIYDRTALAALLRRGRLEVPDETAHRAQFASGVRRLEALGFVRYSAFHYAKREAGRHAYGLWQMQGCNWIGFGMSAMSHIEGEISFNARDIRTYMNRVAAGLPPGQGRRLTRDERMRFAFLYGLRRRELPAAAFHIAFGETVTNAFGVALAEFERRGWVTRTGEAVALTLDGILALGRIEAMVGDPATALFGEAV